MKRERGVTLLEMLIVVAIVGMMAGIAFPAFTAGLDSIRLHSAADSVAAFLNGAVDRSERRQDVIAVVVDPKANRMSLYSTQPGFTRTLEMPGGVNIVSTDSNGAPQRLVLMPGASFPRFAVVLANAKGARKSVAIDSITGAPQITDLHANDAQDNPS